MPPPDMRVTAPLVTVVVISYNHGRYLECCLRSVFEQTYSSIECIVVDNASTDNSREVIAAFRDSLGEPTEGRTLEVFLSPENLNLTGGAIAGFRRSHGAYVAFLDADDYFLPACIETHVRAHLVSRWPVGVSSVDMYQSRERDLVTSARKAFSEYVLSGRGQAKPFVRMDALEAFELSRRPEACALEEKDLHFVDRATSREWVWSPTSGLLFRHEAVELMFAYRPDRIPAGTDAYLVRGISALTGSIVIDKPLVVYRHHGSNMFTTHAQLMNFDSYSKEELAKYEIPIAEEIVECFKSQAPALAGRLDWPDVFIQAVEAASSAAHLPPKRAVSSYTLDFLIENRAMLRDVFGQEAHARWLRMYTRPKDKAFFLRERMARLLRRTAAD